jgi:hypothetical protein
MSQSLLFGSPVRVIQIIGDVQRVVGASPHVHVRLREPSPFRYDLEVVDVRQSDPPLLRTNIDNAFHCRFQTSSLSVSITLDCQAGSVSFELIFDSRRDLDMFVQCFARCQIQQSGQRLLVADDVADLDHYVAYLARDPAVASDIADNNNDEQQPKDTPADGGGNYILRVCPARGNTYVMRRYSDRCALGIFEYSPACPFRMKIPAVSDSRGVSLFVSDMLSHSGDRAFFLLDEQRDCQFFSFDIDRGVVTSEYDTRDSAGTLQPISGLMRQEVADDCVFVAFNRWNTLLVDPRMPQCIVSQSDYRSDNRFTAGACGAGGHIAVGSEKGVVRLYKEPARSRATINFGITPGNAPVLALDVAPGDQWVVAPCPGCIAVIGTLPPSTQKPAFDLPMGDDKSGVVGLHLTAKNKQHIARQNGETMPPFANAKFDIRDGQVSAVLASIGSALVSWPFEPIMSNEVPPYSITFISDEVVVDHVPMQDIKDILYIAPDQVTVVHRETRRRHWDPSGADL